MYSPPCMYMSSSFNLDETIIPFFSVLVCCGGANDTNGIVKCAGLRHRVSMTFLSAERAARHHRLLESNSTLGANPWLTPFARCHEMRVDQKIIVIIKKEQDCGVGRRRRRGPHHVTDVIHFDFHLGNCRRCWMASEEKSPGGRPRNKNLFFPRRALTQSAV